MTFLRSAVPALVAIATASALCACLRQIPPPPVRYFAPLGVSTDASAAGARIAATHTGVIPLELGRVSADDALRQPMVWRLSEVELAFDERHEWISPPSTLVLDALEQALFVDGPFQEAPSASRLDVVVTAFEGVSQARPEARVGLRATLVDFEDRLLERTRRFELSSPLLTRSPEDLAKGMGEALDGVLAELIEWLDAELFAAGRLNTDES